MPVVAYIFSLPSQDQASEPSVIAASGLWTNNGSRGFALGGELYFKENKYRTTAAYVRGNLNYDLYGLGNGSSQLKLPLNQNGQAFFGEFLRRVGWSVFLGPRFLWGSSFITVRNSDTSTVTPPGLGLHTTLTALGVRLNRDTRPNRFYPTTGTLLDFTADFFSQGLGSKYSFQSYKFTFNKYGSLTKNQVLAYNLFACLTGGQPPFYGNCIYGTNNQLRGYVAGRYLDRYMAVTQLEYRLALPKRFGLVAFGGLGEVVPGGNQPFRTTNFLPGGGAGARFELSKKYHVNLRADFAQGKDGHTWSLGVGEAF
ncbi:MAG TPA: BamA/TamA family outer membrane protein [Candidatus Acidoferrum sp.]